MIELDLSRLRLCGRDNEVQELRGAWDGALSSESSAAQLMVIQGAAGCGKSTLVDTFRGRLTPPHLYCYGKFEPEATLDRFATMTNMLTGLLHSIWRETDLLEDSEIKEAARSVAEMLPVSGGSPHRHDVEKKTTEPTTISDPWAFSEIKRAVRTLLRAVSKKRPIICFVDDLQWMDDTSFDLIQAMAETTDTGPFLVEGRPGNLLTKWRLCLAQQRYLHADCSWAI